MEYLYPCRHHGRTRRYAGKRARIQSRRNIFSPETCRSLPFESLAEYHPRIHGEGAQAVEANRTSHRSNLLDAISRARSGKLKYQSSWHVSGDGWFIKMRIRGTAFFLSGNR